MLGEAATITLTGTGTALSQSGTGIFTAGTSTVAMTGPGVSQTLSTSGFTGSNSLYNLTINTGAENYSKVLSAPFTVTNLTTITSGQIDTNSTGNYTFTSGTMVMAASATAGFSGEAATIILNGTGTLLTRGGGSVFTAGTSTFVMNPNASVTLTSGTVPFYNLTLSPAVTSGVTYTSASGATCSNVLLAAPTSVSGTQTLTLAGTMTYGTTCGFTVGGDSNTTTALSAGITVGVFTMSTGGIFSPGSQTMTLSSLTGPLMTYTAGVFNAGTSTVILSGAATTTILNGTAGFVGSNSLYNLTISTPASNYTKVLGAPLSVLNITTITQGGLDTSSSGHYNFSTGSISVAASMTFTANTSNVTITGSTASTLITNSGTFTATSSTIFVTAPTSYTFSSGTLVLNVVNFVPVLASSATYTMPAAGLTFTNTANITINPSASTGTPTLTVKMAVAITLPGTSGSAGTLTIEGAGGATGLLDTVSGSSFGLTVGNVDIEAGGSLNANGSLITVDGALSSGTLFTNNGTLTPGTSTVLMNGASTSGAKMTGGSNLAGAISGTTNFFNNLTLNNASLVAPLGANTTVAGTLTVTAGTLDTNSGTPGNYALSAGFIGTAATGSAKFLPEGSTITLTGTGTGTLFSRGGSSIFTPATSTFLVTSASGSPNVVGSTGTTFYNLTINSAATVINLAASVNEVVSNILDVKSGVFSQGSVTLSGGTLELDPNTTLCLGAAASTTLATCDTAVSTNTDATPSFTTYAFDPTSTVRMVGNSAFGMSATPIYGNVVIAPVLTVNASQSFPGAGAFFVKGNFTVSPTSASATTYTLTTATGGSLTVGGTLSLQERGSVTSDTFNPVGSSLMTVSVGNLDLENGATYTQHQFSSSSVTGLLVTGNLGIASGATLVYGATGAGCWTMYVGGGWANSGTLTFEAGSGSPSICEIVTLNGPTKAVISGSGTNTFPFLSILPSVLDPNTVTVSNASPAVVSTAQLHGLAVGDPIQFSTTGTLPTGLSTGTTYYVISSGYGPFSFEVSATVGGAPVNTSGAGSGTITITRAVDIAKEVDFTAGNTFTVSNGFTVTGHGGALAKLASTSTGTTWTLVPPVTAKNSVAFADVEDSFCNNNTSSTHLISATSSTDDGNNSLAPTSNGCWSFGKPYINFQLSTNAVDFGPLSLTASRYATPGGATGGSASDTSDSAGSSAYATVATSAGNGYTLFVQGASLSNGSYSYTLPGMSLGTPATGTDQFGMRVVATNTSGGSGAALSPYNTSQFVYNAGASTPVAIGSLSGASLLTTTYYMHYVADVSASAPVGNYTTTLTYLVVPNF